MDKINRGNSFLKKFFLNKKDFSYLNINNSILVKILKVSKNFVIVDANLKSLSFINITEFIKEGINPKYLPGKYVPVLIKCIDNGNGSLVLSREKYSSDLFWNYLKFSLKNKRSVFGVIMTKIKGGFYVIVNKYRCFLPYSGVDKKILINFTFYRKRRLPFLVIKFNRKKKNIILSRKLLVKIALIEKKKKLIKFLKPGLIVKGVVKNINNYCVYIDLGYLDGVVLAKNILWGPCKYFNEILQIGQGVLVRVLEITKKGLNIFLGMKQVYPNPWKNILNRYKNNYIKYVRVYKITGDKIYVIFERGIFSYIKKNKLFDKYVSDKKINEMIKINQYLKIKVDYVNIKKRFINFKLYDKESFKFI